jgi:hypothetical protein
VEAPGSVLRLYSKRNVGLKQTRKRRQRRQGPLECPEAVFKDKRWVETNKEKEDDEGGGSWELPKAVFKEKHGVKTNKDKRMIKAGPLGVP